MRPLTINGKTIGEQGACYIIAEMSANHAGSLERAMAIVQAAKDAGADAIKLQTYKPSTMTLDCDNEYFRIPSGSLWSGKTLYELYAQAMTPWEWHAPLKREAQRLGLDFFSTPFDETAVDFLEELGVPLYKIASFELTDDPLLERVARTGRPIIMSTGLASREEIARAMSVLASAHSGPVALLKCTSAYPADFASMNLKGMQELGRLFKVPVGISDHSPGAVVPVAAVALGAVIIEKHLRLNDGEATADEAFSLTPQEFKSLVEDVRHAQSALGKASIGRVSAEEGNARFRRSIFVTQDIAVGEALTKDNVKVIRPGFGLAPSCLPKLLGQQAATALKRGQPLREGDVAAQALAPFALRPAIEADARFLFELRNAPDIRANSRHTGELAWASHEAWFQGKLKDAQCKIYIAQDALEHPVGQVRFDIQGQDAVVSIALISTVRGNGFGSAVLRRACLELFAARREVSTIKALVKVDNLPSVGAFLRAGFVLEGIEAHEGYDFFMLYLMESMPGGCYERV